MHSIQKLPWFPLWCVFSLTLTLCVNHAGASETCKCPAKPAVEKAYQDASLVLVGRVYEQKEETPTKPGFKQVKMTILRRFKGFEEVVNRDYVVIYTPTSKQNCGFSFQNGFDYLIFASGNPASFKTDSCSRTEILEQAQADQEKVIQLSTPK